MADDDGLPPLDLDEFDRQWFAERQATFDAEWRVQTLEVLREALRCYDLDPSALIAVPRLLAAARLAVS